MPIASFYQCLGAAWSSDRRRYGGLVCVRFLDPAVSVELCHAMWRSIQQPGECRNSDNNTIVESAYYGCLYNTIIMEFICTTARPRWLSLFENVSWLEKILIITAYLQRSLRISVSGFRLRTLAYLLPLPCFDRR